MFAAALRCHPTGGAASRARPPSPPAAARAVPAAPRSAPGGRVEGPRRSGAVGPGPPAIGCGRCPRRRPVRSRWARRRPGSGPSPGAPRAGPGAWGR